MDLRCFGRNTRPNRSVARRFGRAPSKLFFFLIDLSLLLGSTTSSTYCVAFFPVLLRGITGQYLSSLLVVCRCSMYYWSRMADALCGRPEACPRGGLRGTPIWICVSVIPVLPLWTSAPLYLFLALIMSLDCFPLPNLLDF